MSHSRRRDRRRNRTSLNKSLAEVARVARRDIDLAFKRGAHDMRARIVKAFEDGGFHGPAQAAQHVDVLPYNETVEEWKGVGRQVQHMADMISKMSRGVVKPEADTADEPPRMVPHPTGRCRCAGEGQCDWCVMDQWRSRALAAERSVAKLATHLKAANESNTELHEIISNLVGEVEELRRELASED